MKIVIDGYLEKCYLSHYGRERYFTWLSHLRKTDPRGAYCHFPPLVKNPSHGHKLNENDFFKVKITSEVQEEKKCDNGLCKIGTCRSQDPRDCDDCDGRK